MRYFLKKKAVKIAAAWPPSRWPPAAGDPPDPVFVASLYHYRYDFL